MLSGEEAAKLLSRSMQKYTPNTVTDAGALEVELATVRTTGVAYDREEYVMGVCAVATPVRDAVGARGALTVELPAGHFFGHEDDLVDALLRHRDDAHRALLGAEHPPVAPVAD
jgi:DNA-binding IclR family transcriptional regulator